MNGDDIKTLREVFKEYKEEHKYWMEAKFDALISKMNDLKIIHEEFKDEITHVFAELNNEVTAYREEYLRECPIRRQECRGQLLEEIQETEEKLSKKIEEQDRNIERSINEVEVAFLNKIPARTMKYIILAVLISAFVGSIVTLITETPVWKHIIDIITRTLAG